MTFFIVLPSVKQRRQIAKALNYEFEAGPHLFVLFNKFRNSIRALAIQFLSGKFK
jgi:hypothetical protein